MILINALTRDKKRKKRYQVEETEPQLISIVDTEQFFFFFLRKSVNLFLWQFVKVWSHSTILIIIVLCYTVLGTSSSKKTLNNSASISSSTQSIHSLSSMPGDMSQVDGRVGRWALGFDKLMEDPAGLGCFKVHEQKFIFFKMFSRLASCSWFGWFYCLLETCKPVLKKNSDKWKFAI